MSPSSIRKPSKREQTRARVIQAAIDCIYEEGFHAAHTNRIVARAGVSWGVLQYHFGDKDGLLRAVLDHIFSEYSDSLALAATTQGLLKNRIRELIDIIWALVSLPEYRVSMAILRNIDRSPESTISSQQFVETWGREIGTLWDQVFHELIEAPERSDIAKRIMFAALRGFADELNPRPGEENQDLHQELDALADSITSLVSH